MRARLPLACNGERRGDQRGKQKYDANQTRHNIDRWTTAWVLENAQPLTEPVPYDHPLGAVQPRSM